MGWWKSVCLHRWNWATITRGWQQSQFSHIKHIPAVSCYTSVCATTTAVHVLKASPKRTTNATKIGMHLHPKWKQIMEEFTHCEKVHWVRYTCFIDSSVYPTLIANVPVWGHAIRKIECAKHVCKCYCAGLEKLVHAHPHYIGKGGFTQRMRWRLTSFPMMMATPHLVLSVLVGSFTPTTI